ncbi:hypothetical protein [Niallia sp. 03133]|uniref:hypothetical protein n=1 Tax=Niallia sp. 03133 TaxID=3458060 RepID=UPI004044F03D
MQTRYIFGFIFTFLTFFYMNLNTYAAENNVSNSAQQYADNNFKNIVLDIVKSEESTTYNLSKSENITFSKLYRVNVLSSDFVTTNDEINNSNKGIVPSDEWIAVVYQEEKPVNVIGTFKKENGEFDLSTFGYGKDLAEAIDNKQPNGGKLIYELPTDSWFLFSNGRVSAVNTAAKAILKTDVSLGEFRKFVNERYKNQEVIYENGEAVSVGGNYAIPYKKDSNSNYYFIGLGVLVLVLSIIVLIKLKSKKLKRD